VTIEDEAQRETARRRLSELHGSGTVGAEARSLAVQLIDYERRRLAQEPEAALGLLRGVLRRMRIDAPVVAALAEVPLTQAHDMLDGRKVPGPRLVAQLVELSAFPLGDLIGALAAARRGRGRPPAAERVAERATNLGPEAPEPVPLAAQPDPVALAVASIAARRPAVAAPSPRPPVRVPPRPAEAIPPQPPNGPSEAPAPEPEARPAAEPEAQPAPEPEEAPPPKLSPVAAMRERLAARRQQQRGGRFRR
jgi:hypothetical protein